MTTSTAFAKSIRYERATRDYRAELDGVLIGYFATYHQAEEALDDVAYERLIDGDCATAADMDAPIAADDVPAGDPPSDPLPDPGPGGPGVPGDERPPIAAFPACLLCLHTDEPPSGLVARICRACANALMFGLPDRFAAVAEADRRRAHTAQSIQIEARLATCGYCQGMHHIQRCPEIAVRLFAEPDWKDVALGRELCRMRWRDFRSFVALLLSVPAEHLIIYAASYQAFIRSYNDQSTVTITEIVQSWTRDMQRGGDRGPAAQQLAA